MKITFVLPGPSFIPIGGYKIIYEYANRLLKRGHKITVIHPQYINIKLRFNKKSLKLIIRYLITTVKRKFNIKPWQWFNIKDGIRMRTPLRMEQFLTPNADIIVATLWSTSEEISNYHHKKGNKFYFIQGLETVFCQEKKLQERVVHTWKLPFKKIVISRWLERIIQDAGENCIYIPNGIDFDNFNIDIPIESRDNRIICIINNELEFKGTADGLHALLLVKKEYPDVSVLMFGLPPRPNSLPARITYYQNPSHREIRNIYNKSAIFIGPSWSEGFGLPGCEAAACGAALCMADNGGHREYAIHNETALLHPPKHPTILAENIINLLQDNNKRIKLAQNANEYIKKFSWDRSVIQMEQAFKAAITKMRQT